jgi:transposase
MAAQVVIMPIRIACPSCPICGTKMSLITIVPDKPGHDRRTYECSRCQHEHTEIIQLSKVS